MRYGKCDNCGKEIKGGCNYIANTAYNGEMWTNKLCNTCYGDGKDNEAQEMMRVSERGGDVVEEME